MGTKIERRQLIRAIKTVRRCNPACIGLEVIGGKLEVIGTDLEVWARYTVMPIESGFDWRVLLDAGLLYKTIMRIKADTVTLEPSDGGTVLIVSGGSSKAKFHTRLEDPLSWPTGALEHIQVDRRKLAVAFRFVGHALCCDDTRAHLGVRLALGENLEVSTCTTDGHRLALCETGAVRGQLFELNLPQSAHVLLRLASKGKGSVVLSKPADEAELAVFEHKGRTFLEATFRGDGESCSLTVQALEDRFPPFERILPKLDEMHWLEVERSEVLEAAKRCKGIHNQNHGMLVVDPREPLRLVVEEPGEERWEECLQGWRGDAVKAQLGLNVDYLADALSAFTGERIRFYYEEQALYVLAPVEELADERVRALIMPVRL